MRGRERHGREERWGGGGAVTERERETRKGREVGGGSGERERETRKGRDRQTDRQTDRQRQREGRDKT